MAKIKKKENKGALALRPEDLIYKAAYAPVDLRDMLASAENRGRIRRLPVSHLFFGLEGLDEEEIQTLLPHVTEEQWTGILDLDLWQRDKVNTGKFIYWEHQVVQAEDAVARKIMRAADPELWELTFKRDVKIYARISEDEYEGEPEGEFLITPDKNYLIELPRNAEKARRIRPLILRLFELEPDLTALLIESSRARTPNEIQETAYQKRKDRVEEWGFQDYFDAIEIYTYRDPRESLPEKTWEPIREITTLPVSLAEGEEEGLLLFQALARIDRPQEVQSLLEELFFVCNKVLSADMAPAGDLTRVRRGVRKTITGINLGLDWWADGDIHKAIEGLRRYYLQSFFQVGHSRLVELQREAKRLKESSEPEPGSFLEQVVEGLLKKYPLLAEQRDKKSLKRFLRTRQDLQTARRYLEAFSAQKDEDTKSPQET